MSIWHNFICTNRPNLTRLCHVIMKSCQVVTTSYMTEVVSSWQDFSMTWKSGVKLELFEVLPN